MKTVIIVLACSILISFQYFFIKDEMKLNSEIREFHDSIVSAKICFVGDLMCHSTQFNYAKVNSDSFDFRGVFREVKKYLTVPDLTVGNLETVIAGKNKNYSGYPYFNAPDNFIYALKDAGFNLLTTANNHALDQGWEGVKRTIDVLNYNKIHRTGTFISEADKDSLRIFRIHSITIAVLAYTENTNGIPIPQEKDFIINLIAEEKIRQDIIKARTKNVDIILIYLHYGNEYEREPNEYQKEVVQKLIKLGADIIIGGHPHVIQPFDYFKTCGSKLDSGFIAYSMGNFISNQRWRYSDAGVILNIEISKNIFTDSVYLSEISYLPTWVFRGNTDKGREYIILPSHSSKDTTYKFLSDGDRKLMTQAFDDTEEIINKYKFKFKLIYPE
jgi:poly-gamma-glutamate capsule biosynthesis protein CapA/YwtB (metallophosphatase superfamily)